MDRSDNSSAPARPGSAPSLSPDPEPELSTPDGVLQRLRALLVGEGVAIPEGQSLRELSLTRSLHMDSLQLTLFLSGIRTHLIEEDMTEWLLASAQSGDDTLGSLGDFIFELWSARARG